MALRNRKVFDSLAVAALVAGAIALAARDTPHAVAEDEVSSEPSAPEGEAPAQAPPQNPFEPYAKDPGHWRYEHLSPEGQRVMDRAAEWAEADHYGVHQAYRGAARFGAAFARQKRAEREAGLEGIADVGVR